VYTEGSPETYKIDTRGQLGSSYPQHLDGEELAGFDRRTRSSLAILLREYRFYIYKTLIVSHNKFTVAAALAYLLVVEFTVILRSRVVAFSISSFISDWCGHAHVSDY